jgi:hypothetical protein
MTARLWVTPHRHLSDGIDEIERAIHLLRRHNPRPNLRDDTFPELWNRAADPFAPLADLPGAYLGADRRRGRPGALTEVTEAFPGVGRRSRVVSAQAPLGHQVNSL